MEYLNVFAVGPTGERELVGTCSVPTLDVATGSLRLALMLLRRDPTDGEAFDLEGTRVHLSGVRMLAVVAALRVPGGPSVVLEGATCSVAWLRYVGPRTCDAPGCVKGMVRVWDVGDKTDDVCKRCAGTGVVTGDPSGGQG